MTGEQILVVEDEAIIAYDIRTRLEKMGYVVPSIVSSGEEAIKKVDENHFDLVLMDIMLNGGMDGIDTAEQIHSRYDIPIVYLTAHSDETTLERAKITEPFGYIIKPFREREMKINLEIALYKHKIEKRIKENERWLAASIKSIGDAVISTDTKGTIKLMNPLAEALTGWKMEDTLGMHLSTVFNVVSEENSKSAEDPIAKVIREDCFYGLADNTVLVTKGGLKIPVDIIGSSIRDDGNNLIGVVLVFYDITERKKLEAKLKREAPPSKVLV